MSTRSPFPEKAPSATRTVCYLVGEYPAISHTFIDREVQALRALGQPVETVSLHRTPEDRLLTGHDRAEAERTWNIQPLDRAAVVRAHARMLRISPRRYSAALLRAQRAGAPGARGALWKLFYWAEAVYLADRLRRQGISHVHAHFANSASWVAMLAAYLNDGTWSFSMHGPTEFDDVDHYALATKVSDATFVACIGDYCRVQLMRTCPPEQWPKLVTVRCGVNAERYFTGPDTPDGLKNTPPVLLSVGRLMPDKGQRILIEALASLRAEGFEFRARLVGDGPDRDRLRTQIEAARLADCVELMGKVGQDDLPAMYRESDLFVLPSFAEGIPVVLMEAMACGVPVISSAVMGVGELVAHGTTGRLVHPGRPDLLAAAIRAALTDRETTVAMAETARRRVAEEFTFPANVEPLRRAFAQALDR